MTIDDPTGEICYNAYALFRKSLVYVLEKVATPIERKFPPREGDDGAVQKLNRKHDRETKRLQKFRKMPLILWTKIYWTNAFSTFKRTMKQHGGITLLSGAVVIFTMS
ncbi:hypothetical protein TrCOL_g4477 [Triparma columacea]|uniref:Uncharacterized protein n=1 Tax=Triparma columacea TaxID=722753 RepID=A0A9W7FVN7_9STRA|nr:hypothetical protein TrCOL_g4477 [Triparma columacea]